jgi:hypothetical protein
MYEDLGLRREVVVDDMVDMLKYGCRKSVYVSHTVGTSKTYRHVYTTGSDVRNDQNACQASAEVLYLLLSGSLVEVTVDLNN